MRVLDRYIVKSFLSNYLLSLGVLISLYVSLDLFVNFDEFTEGGQRAHVVLRNITSYYLYNLPLYFSQISGVITLFAACGTLVRLHRQNEITAVLASGTSLYRLATPLVMAGFLTNILVVVDHEVLLPSVAPKLARSRDDVAGERVYDIWCIRDGENRLLSAMMFAPKQQKIRNLIVMELSENPMTPGRLESVITADKAAWNADEGGWMLERGMRLRVAEHGGAGISRSSNIEYDPLDFYASTLPPDELLFRQTAQWMRFLSIKQLDELEQRQAADQRTLAQIKHGRFTLPINNMILLMIGLTFFLHRVPGSILNQGAKALGVCAVVFILSFVGQQMVGAGVSGTTSAFLQALPAWMPILVFGPVTVVMLDSVKT